MLVGGWSATSGAEPSPPDMQFFETKVHPLLVQHCYVTASRFPVMRGAAGRCATVVVLDSRFFGSLQNGLGGLPVDRLEGQLETIRTGGPTGGLYTDDAFYRDHPVFAGFPENGMFDDVTFRNVVRSDVWVNHTPPTRLVAGVINTSLKGYGRGFRSGLLLGEYRQGQGVVVVNTLNLVPNLRSDPVAGRLLKNMLGHYGFEAGRNK